MLYGFRDHTSSAVFPTQHVETVLKLNVGINVGINTSVVLLLKIIDFSSITSENNRFHEAKSL